MSVDQAFNFKRVDELTATAGLLGTDQLSALGPEGFTVVINLLPDDSEYAQAEEAQMVQNQGIEYIYIPVDFDAPTKNDYAQFEAAMQRTEGKARLVHCAANYRVSAFYAIYAHRHLGWDVGRAREHIASIWDTREFPAWHSLIDGYLSDKQA